MRASRRYRARGARGRRQAVCAEIRRRTENYPCLAGRIAGGAKRRAPGSREGSDFHNENPRNAPRRHRESSRASRRADAQDALSRQAGRRKCPTIDEKSVVAANPRGGGAAAGPVGPTTGTLTNKLTGRHDARASGRAGAIED